MLTTSVFMIDGSDMIVMDGGASHTACNKVEGDVRERDEDDAETETDTIAVGIREGDEDKKEMIDGSTTSGERDGDGAETETDTIAVGIREGDKEEIDGDVLEGLLSTAMIKKKPIAMCDGVRTLGVNAATLAASAPHSVLSAQYRPAGHVSHNSKQVRQSRDSRHHPLQLQFSTTVLEFQPK
jgi:hypothetical protein